MEQTLFGLSKRLRLAALERHHQRRAVLVAFAAINTTVSVGLIGLVARYANSLLLFPSLGPTAFLLFVRPMDREAAPEHVIIGHFLGIVAGWVALLCFGLRNVPPSLLSGSVAWRRVAAVALSMALTSGFMVAWRKPHAPACATTLVISLGFVRQPWQFPLLLGGVVLLAMQAFVINRLAGLRYPWWRAVDAKKERR